MSDAVKKEQHVDWDVYNNVCKERFARMEERLSKELSKILDNGISEKVAEATHKARFSYKMVWVLISVMLAGIGGGATALVYLARLIMEHVVGG